MATGTIAVVVEATPKKAFARAIDWPGWARSGKTEALALESLAAYAPRYAPVDEDHYPLPTTTYALSKVASEVIAGQIAKWSAIPFIALRFSNIMVSSDYQEFPAVWSQAHARKWNLWSYVDARDVAAACRLALEAPHDAVAASPSFVIAAADTVMNRSSSALLDEVFPDVPLTREVGEFDSLLAIDRAREVLGYEPRHSWRDHLPAS